MTTESKQKDDDMADLRASIDRLTKDVASLHHSLAEILKTRVGGAVHDIRDGVKTAAGEIGDKSHEAKEAVEKTIRERPFQMLLGAFGLGLLIARLIRRNKSA